MSFYTVIKRIIYMVSYIKGFISDFSLIVNGGRGIEDIDPVPIWANILAIVSTNCLSCFQFAFYKATYTPSTLTISKSF